MSSQESSIIQHDPTVTDWYRPGKSIREFHLSKARTRVLIGGRGSGKTTAVAMEALGHCMHNAGARVMILRKTQTANDETTLRTFEESFEKCGLIQTETSLFKKIEGGKKFRIPSRLALEKYAEFTRVGRSKSEILLWIETVGRRLCGEIGFEGIPTAQFRATKLRGYECSLLVFVEADQLTWEDLAMSRACLRWKGADPKTCDEKGVIKDMGLILDSNPPSEMHWIARWEWEKCADTDEERRKKYNKSGRVDCGPDLVFFHLETAMNRHNLPDNYVEDLIDAYKRNQGMLDRMCYGLYSDAFDGKPVFYNFDASKHAFVDLPFPKGAYLVRGFDYGTTHAVIWSAYWEMNGDEFFWDLYEYFAENSDAETQARRTVELTEKVFPFWNNREHCAGILDYGDPAGLANKDTGSSVKVLNTYGIFPGSSRIGLQESIALVNRLFEKKDKHGQHIYRIDKENCPRLYRALGGGYRFPEEGEPGWGSDEPLKGVRFGNHDHLADSSRYSKIGVMRLLKAEYEDKKGNVGKLARKLSINPPRRWR